MDNIQALLTIFVIAAATLLTRAIAFILFPSAEKTPKFILYIGKVLPCATFGMLIIYCLKSVSLTVWPSGLPELIAIFATALIQYYKRSLLLSIVVGTVLYMLLIQLVFV
jgi:Predicted branched-chain amino acid permeases (azaleucine resistance)